MINILLSGCNGKMGQVVTTLVSEYENVSIVAGVDLNSSIKNTYVVYDNVSKVKESVDVIIDFSHPSAFTSITDFSIKKNIPIVMATTGLSSTQKNALEKMSKKTPVFFSANMSIGINLIMSLCQTAAKFLDSAFDIEIIEKHHNQKVDAPSGTALAIADKINDTLDNNKEYIYNRQPYRKKREKKEIGIHAVRGGSITGEHTVLFAGQNEIIEIKHEALSKDIFARGAIKAAIFMKNKPKGFYNMESIIKAQ